MRGALSLARRLERASSASESLLLSKVGEGRASRNTGEAVPLLEKVDNAGERGGVAISCAVTYVRRSMTLRGTVEARLEVLTVRFGS